MWLTTADLSNWSMEEKKNDKAAVESKAVPQKN